MSLSPHAVRRAAPLLVTCALLALPVSPACGQATGGARKTAEASAREVRVMSKEAVIRSATSAAPAHIAKDATVLGPGANGELVELRHGTNGWTCLPDQPDTPGRDPMCLDEQGMAWAQSWMKHEAKPANTAPGIGYMLRGGSDISATDPWAKSTSHYVASPPHWMLLWPVDAEKSGLPTKPKKTGTWIMWAGTPYAHLMINQVP